MCFGFLLIVPRFEHDKKYGLGLLKDPRALNTALSRVTSLLVIVGDPYVLSTDEHWQKIMTVCRENKAYIGPTVGAKYLQEREAEVRFSQSSLSSLYLCLCLSGHPACRGEGVA